MHKHSWYANIHEMSMLIHFCTKIKTWSIFIIWPPFRIIILDKSWLGSCDYPPLKNGDREEGNILSGQHRNKVWATVREDRGQRCVHMFECQRDHIQVHPSELHTWPSWKLLYITWQTVYKVVWRQYHPVQINVACSLIQTHNPYTQLFIFLFYFAFAFFL